MHATAQRSSGIASTLFPALLAWVLGNALQLQQAQLQSWPVYCAVVLLSPVLYALAITQSAASGWRVAGVFLALLALGWGVAGLRASVFLTDALNPALEGQDLRITGVVSGLPQRSETGLRFRLQVESAQRGEQTIDVPQVMDVGWYAGAYSISLAPASAAPADGFDRSSGLSRQPGDLKAGERWQMTLRLKAPHGGRNPHGFDYELWLWEQGVQATGYVRAGAKDAAPVPLGQTWTHPVALARQTVRDQIFATVEQRQAASLIAALLVGDQNAIERTDWDLFRATGVAHLVSISGLHITMFAWGAALWVGWLWRRSGYLCLLWPAPSAALLGGVLLATAYSVFSGWGVPAQRTCLMLATVAVLRLCGARWPWPHVWMLACAAVVAMDPWSLLQPGFWLSFVAVGILFATDSGAMYSMDMRAKTIYSKILGGLREQWVITVALTPLTLLLFGQVSLVGLAANVLAIPWVTLVVTPLAMLGAVLPVLWDGAALAIGWLLIYLQWLATWPWAAINVAIPPLWAGAAGVMGGVLLVAPLPWSLRGLGLPLLLPVLLWQAPVPPPGQFELLVADIGQGNAVLVRTARHALLYDAGPRYSLESDAGNRVLVPLLQALHVRLDTVVISHRDMDHVGGAAAVLAMQPQAQLLSSIEAGHPLQAVHAAQRCSAGQRWNWDGVEFSFLHPQTTDYDKGARPNALSCVLRISNGARTALLVGDIEKAQEAQLVASGAALKADVLLVPHHGSKTSSSAEFLEAVAPRLAVVQAGYRNRFGHPAPSVLERYRERHIVVIDSPHCGALTWRSWQADMPLAGACERRQGQRYWHHPVP